MPARGIVTWNSIVDGYVSTRALGSRAAGLLQEMHEVRHDRVGIIHHSCRLLPEIGVDGRAWAWRKTPRDIRSKLKMLVSYVDNLPLGENMYETKSRVEKLEKLYANMALQKEPKVKKSGKNEKADMSEFTAQLDSIGFKIVEVTVDGNCFLRFCSNTHHLDKIGGFCSYLCFTVTIT
ncbi:hypothetical protein VPH35_138913 [Triticum aestivum]|uniref:OTU domain-containing protein n=1 Tax=Aegilops tauschii TaxID=37682 RepID=M8BEW7_AEGTA